MLQEFDKQIFQEGTSYEGSTAYHGLVTELFCHAFLLSNNLGYAWIDRAEQKLLRMLEFMRWCTPQEGALITIGDNDSGHVLLRGLSEGVIALIKKTIALPLSSLNNEVKIYPEFGVAIINTKQVHCSLRAPSYNPLQPSGHFHADALSMTLAIDGRAVFVDPGSYVYTPSALWRNYFRSMKIHNTFMITNKEPIPLSEDLFSVSVPSGRSCIKQNGYSIYSSHDWYAYVGFRAYRKIIYLKDQKKIIITDWWESINNKATSDVLDTTWNFTLDAQLHVSQDGSAYSIVKNDMLLARISSPDLVFKSVPAWVSPAYGQKYEAYALSSQKIISPHTFITTTIDIV